MTGLQDLNTGKDSVQEIEANYLKHLLDMGVYGFRIDAAKHISTKDIQGIKAKLAEKTKRTADDIFFEQEVIGNSKEAPEIQPVNYLDNGKVSEFNFTNHLAVAFSADITDKTKGLGQVGSDGWVASDKASVFVTNWDTERGSALTYKKGSKYLLANAFMLGYDYGQPHVYSGYYFDDNDDGAPGATATSVPDMQCPTNGDAKSGTWQCAERWTAVRGMVGFHNAVYGTKVTQWKSYGANVLGFARGDKGYLALNNSPTDSHQTFATGLPAGTYCNVYATGDCSETVDVKSDGTFTADVKAGSAIAVYAGATENQWTGTQKSDPSDPDLSQFDGVTLPTTDTSRTIYYKLPKDWNSATIHYGFDDWQTTDDQQMQTVDNGWVSTTLDPGKQSLEFVFTDGNGNWDKPSEGGNYAPLGHWTSIQNNTSKEGVPDDLQNYQPKTTVIVHYKPADEIQRGVYLWGTRKDGSSQEPAYYQFSGSDAFGQVFNATIDGAYDKGKIGVIVTTTDGTWNKVGADRNIDGSNGTAEIWVDGHDPDATSDTAPDGSTKRADTINVTVHYHRNIDDYTNADGTKAWDIWGWADGVNGSGYPFTEHDMYGLTSHYTLNGASMSAPQLIVRYGGDAWDDKDPDDSNRTIPQSAITIDKDGSARAEVWLLQGDATVYTNGTLFNGKGEITKAEMTGFSTLKATLNKAVPSGDLSNIASIDNVAISDVKADGNVITIKTEKELSVTTKYTLKVKGFGKKVVSLGELVRSDAFDKRYGYDGKDLGATRRGSSVQFKLWAPTATKVSLNVYASNAPGAEKAQTYPLTSGKQGVWSYTLEKSSKDVAYDYSLEFADGTTTESPDPYAKSAVENGQRSVILTKGEQGNAGKRMTSFADPSNAIISETSVRDFSIDPDSGISPAHQGKFLGLTETGTKSKNGTTSGLDYLKQLGITHVQLMPVYEFGSIDESGDLSYGKQYNWGYDPQNYNVPEGAYSTDPANPSSRVTEMKQMVKSLHNNGLRVVMDVVYNHVYDAANHAFNKTVPGYYYRYNSNGDLRNDSGCGNDTASERRMMRKYIVDSVTYWATTYNIDGFRFDLMGLIDQTTMNEVRSTLNAIDPSILVIGEGWDMTDGIGDQATTQPHANNVKGVSFFNDSFRDAIKGSVFSDTDTGFISGKAATENLISTNLMGCFNGRNEIDATGHCNNGKADSNYADPSQVVQYAEIHDNLTLYDKLRLSRPDDDDATTVKRAKLADSLIFLSQGITDMQLGQEFLRTKGGNSNSYNAGDAVNAIVWDRSLQYKDSVDYVRGLIELRKSIGQLHLKSYADIAKHMTILKQSDGVVAYRLQDGDDSYVVVFNANENPANLSNLDSGNYRILLSDGQVHSKNPATISVKSSGYQASGLGATVLQYIHNGQDNTDGGKSHEDQIASTGSEIWLISVAAVLLMAGSTLMLVGKSKRK